MIELIVITEAEVVEFIEKNEILFSVFIAILIVKAKEFSKRNTFLAGLVYFVGTFFHELSHYIAALITTLSFPKGLSLLPKSSIENGQKGITLGEVRIENRKITFFNAFLIGLAPLSLLYLAYLVSLYFFSFYGDYFEVGLLAHLLYLFLISTLIVNSIPSRADLKIAFSKGSAYFYLILAIFAYLY